MATVGGRSQETPRPAETEAVLAAFVYNVCLFTEWPDPLPDAGNREFVLALAGRPLPALATLGKRKVGGRPVRIVYLAADEAVPALCDAVLCNAMDDDARRAVLAQTGHRPILTLSPDPGFCQSGGIVEFFVRDERMRFRVSLPNLSGANLRISSQLLKLADIIPIQAGGN